MPNEFGALERATQGVTNRLTRMQSWLKQNIWLSSPENSFNNIKNLKDLNEKFKEIKEDGSLQNNELIRQYLLQRGLIIQNYITELEKQKQMIIDEGDSVDAAFENKRREIVEKLEKEGKTPARYKQMIESEANKAATTIVKQIGRRLASFIETVRIDNAYAVTFKNITGYTDLVDLVTYLIDAYKIELEKTKKKLEALNQSQPEEEKPDSQEEQKPEEKKQEIPDWLKPQGQSDQQGDDGEKINDGGKRYPQKLFTLKVTRKDKK